MNILVYGSGGREHAVVKALTKSPAHPKIFIFPGNDGIIEAERPEGIDTSNKKNEFQSIAHFCKNQKIDFVFIGPEEPLCQGLSTVLRDQGIHVVGPDEKAAQLEGSKIFSKNFMLKYKIPTAKAYEVSSVGEVERYLPEFKQPFVLKADGLAAGKGVVVTDNSGEILTTAKDFFENGLLGSAGTSALLEEGLTGWEMSVLLFTNGKDFEILPVAQDHKRLSDQDLGPNTGGMGTIAPVELSPDLKREITENIIRPTLHGLTAEGWLYYGVLFIGIMVTPDGLKVLEYNVRLGDPETQVVIPLIENDLAQVLFKLAKGEIEKLKFKSLSACCVVMAAPGYPQNPVKDVPIEGDLFAEGENSYFIHAGVRNLAPVGKNQWVTNGGRVMGSIGLGTTNDEAIKNAYEQLSNVKWNGIQFRKDIGQNFS